MTNPHTPGKIGVTIKVPESKRYAADNPWFVFEGYEADEVKANIAAVFGIETEGLTLADVVINAQRLASTLGTASHGLEGTVLSSGPGNGSQASSEAPSGSGGDVWAQAAAAKRGDTPAEEPADPILTAIEGSTTVPELQQVWAENQEAFNTNDSYMAAYKAKGKALTGN